MCPSGRIASPGFLPSYERCCGQSSTCWVCSVAMGQPRVASATWRARNKRISRDSYEPVGQPVRQTMASKPMWVWDQAKTLNHVSRQTTKSLRKPRWNPLGFPLMGPVCFRFLYSLDLFIPVLDLHYDEAWVPNPQSSWWVHCWLCMEMILGWVLVPLFL